MLLAESPFGTNTVKAQTALPTVNVDAPTQRPKPARASEQSQRRTQAVTRRSPTAAPPAAPTPSERAAADAAAQQAAKLGYRAMPSASTLRSGASPLDTSQSVNVVPAQVIKDQLPRNIDDALVNISGITQTNTLAGTQDAVIRRGFGDNRDGSIMRNGMPLVQGRSLNAAVDSVEVLKGPASLLYGIMDPGGIVNTISKRPELYQHGSVSLLGLDLCEQPQRRRRYARRHRSDRRRRSRLSLHRLWRQRGLLAQFRPPSGNAGEPVARLVRRKHDGPAHL